MIYTLIISLILATASCHSGCNIEPASAIGKTTDFNFTMHDPATDQDIVRSYKINVPSNYDPSKKYPVVYWFHGWSSGSGQTNEFVTVGQANDVITVYPLGMADETEKSPGRNSWNVGDANRTNTCTRTTGDVCYTSCRNLNMCSRCNCFTCVDDIAFVRTLIARINEGYCTDESRLYVGGASNGGMFTYYLAGQIPELVTGGYLLMCGQPMVGWLNTPALAAESYMLSLHGRSDDVLPPAGGVDGDDMWVYESLNNTFYVWG
jgi:polyhydroxybutyrate depolymerase